MPAHNHHKTCSTRLCLDDPSAAYNVDEKPMHKCVFRLAAQNGTPIAQAFCMPSPTKGTLDGTNCQWDTKHFGTLQLCTLPCSLMKSIYEVGRCSTPYCHNLCAQAQVAPELAQLTKQHIDSDDKDLHVWKTPDGYLLTDKDTHVFALIHAKGFHYHDSNKNKCTGNGNMLIVAHPPNTPPALKFKAVLHNGVCEPHEISRMGAIEHSMRKILSSVVYEEAPRVVYTSPMGEMAARILTGEKAILVKSCFVNMLQQEGCDAYNTRLDLHPDLAQLLMLKSSTGNLRCIPCANGFIGYRIQVADPTKRTLVLLANSSDTGGDSIHMGDDSNLQVFKFNYVDNNGTERFVIRNTEADCSGPFDIPCTDTVQGILNRVEKAFRDSLNWGSDLHPFELGANLTCKLRESSRFIDPDVKETESNRVIQQFIMQYMSQLHDNDVDWFGKVAAAA